MELFVSLKIRMKVIFRRPYRNIKSLYEKIKRKRYYYNVQRHYRYVEKNIKNRNDKRLRFGAYVLYDSSFGADEIFKYVLNSSRWKDNKIVIIPDVLRGENHMKDTYLRTKEFFVKKYGEQNIVDGYNVETGNIYDLSDCFDVIYCANPYDSMVNRIHSIKYLSSRNCLPIYISYGYDISRTFTKERLKGDELNLVWKYFVDTKYSYIDCLKYQCIHGRNATLVGYAKMDNLVISKNDCTERKKILIAIHHTIDDIELPLSNFLEYYDFIADLPSMYENVDFVFRPHPLLFRNMINRGFWSQKDASDYLGKIEKAGMVYSYGGDYLDLFDKCDAIINDCGSFTVEWLYTGKPGCFIKNKKLKKEQLTSLMNKSIEYYSVATCKEEIIEFIDKICNEELCDNEIKACIKKKIMLNYPEVSSKIISTISIN